jgi:hypothetical protein
MRGTICAKKTRIFCIKRHKVYIPFMYKYGEVASLYKFRMLRRETLVLIKRL